LKKLDETIYLLKALGDPTRYRIMSLLSSSENNLCVNALSKKLGVSQPVVSQHLKILKNAGLVGATRRGNHMHYRADRKRLEELGGRLNELFTASAGKCSDKECPSK
jgi:ArsR family transcriptional regulator